MGTSWSVAAALPAGARDDLAASITTVLDGIIAEMSNWEADSVISRFNRAPVGRWQALPAAFMTVLRAGLEIAALSGGAFDPAIGLLVDHFGFGPGPAGGSAAPHPGWQAIEIGHDAGSDRARRLAPVALDFSGIAKGHAVDAVAAHLHGLGIDDFLVEIGGELRGAGLRPDGAPWWVDIEPVPGLAQPVTRLALYGLAVATSGDYRRFAGDGGRRISHNIDPRTAAPVANGVASVTIVHPSAMLADAWATALLVLGPAAGMALAGENGLAAMMVTRKPVGASETLSPAFAALLA